MSIVQTAETETIWRKRTSIHTSYNMIKIHWTYQYLPTNLSIYDTYLQYLLLPTSTHPRVVRLACSQHSSMWQYHWWCRQGYIPPQDAQRTRSIQLYMMERRAWSIHPSVYQSVYRYIHICIYRSTPHLSIYPSFHLNIHSSIHLLVHTSIYLSIHTSIHPSIHLLIHQSIHLSMNSSPPPVDWSPVPAPPPSRKLPSATTVRRTCCTVAAGSDDWWWGGG